MAKNIVICCDGTGNEFGESKSNVVKLYKMLVQDASQIAYYHPGVGTMGARNALTGISRWWTKVIGLAFGYGISDNIADAYQFLMRNFQPDDTVYVFGFSRGAYTARALCGMLYIIGLLREDNEGLIPYSIRMIKEKTIDFGVAADFNKTFCRECKAHFVGVWDTVSSVGWVYNVAHFPGTKATHNPGMRVIRHAVSINERRAFFRQNLFGPPHDPQQDVKEIWFAGVHSDVGGSYPEPESQLSKIALQWMVCEAERAGLRVDQDRKADILGGKPPYVAPDPLTKNQHESLKGAWWIAELWPKVFSYPVSVAGQAQPNWKRGIRLNLGRARTIPSGVHIHQSVFDRIRDVPSYKPKNLPQQYVTEPESPCELVPRPVHEQPTIAPSKRPMLRRPSVIGALALLAVLGVCAAVIAVFTIHNSLEVPKIERPKRCLLASPKLDGRSASSVSTTRRREVSSCLTPGFSRWSSRDSLSRGHRYSGKTPTCKASVLFRTPPTCRIPTACRSDSRAMIISLIPTPGRKMLCSALLARLAIPENCSLAERRSGLTPGRR